MPKNTQIVRVAVESDEQGRIGTANVDLKTVNAAPDKRTPTPAAP